MTGEEASFTGEKSYAKHCCWYKGETLAYLGGEMIKCLQLGRMGVDVNGEREREREKERKGREWVKDCGKGNPVALLEILP